MIKVGFLGAGKMAQSLAKGFISAGKEIHVFLLHTGTNLKKLKAPHLGVV